MLNCIAVQRVLKLLDDVERLQKYTWREQEYAKVCPGVCVWGGGMDACVCVVDARVCVCVQGWMCVQG